MESNRFRDHDHLACVSLEEIIVKLEKVTWWSRVVLFGSERTTHAEEFCSVCFVWLQKPLPLP
jgi:hypothetical protein